MGINYYHILTFHARLTHHQYPCVCGILPKNCRMAPSPLDTQTTPCDTWHHSFHPDVSHPELCPANVPPYPDVSHPEFFFADIPPGCLTSRILLRRHSTWISHIRNFVPANVPPSPDISHSEFCPADVPPCSSSLEHFLEVFPKSHFQ